MTKVSQKAGKAEAPPGDKAKLAEVGSKTTVVASVAKAGAVEMPQKPKNIQEELRKISAKLNQEKKSRTGDAFVQKSKETGASSPVAKRKKSFWDPDSDTEYDRLVKKASSVTKKLRTKKSDSDPKGRIKCFCSLLTVPAK